MISNVKGKTEISLDLPDDGLPAAFYINLPQLDLFLLHLLVRVNEDHATRHPLAVSRSDKVNATPYP